MSKRKNRKNRKNQQQNPKQTYDAVVRFNSEKGEFQCPDDGQTLQFEGGVFGKSKQDAQQMEVARCPQCQSALDLRIVFEAAADNPSNTIFAEARAAVQSEIDQIEWVKGAKKRQQKEAQRRSAEQKRQRVEAQRLAVEQKEAARVKAQNRNAVIVSMQTWAVFVAVIATAMIVLW